MSNPAVSQKKTKALRQKTKMLQYANRQFAKTQTQLMRALEEAEKANRKLKVAQAELVETKKRALLAGISSAVGHEIRNGLTPVMGQLYYIHRDLDCLEVCFNRSLGRLTVPRRKEFRFLIDSFKERFTKLQRGADRIRGVVSTLVNLVRDRSEEKGAVQLKLVIESALEEVKFQTYWETLTVPAMILDVPEDLPFVCGVTKDLHGVFVNLIVNALHAMAGKMNKEIRIEASVDAKKPECVKINFSDNGAGIPKELLKKVFEHGFTTKGIEGTGIGLFYCKDNIERVHNGSIEVRSKVGSGTCFTIRLPIYHYG